MFGDRSSRRSLAASAAVHAAMVAAAAFLLAPAHEQKRAPMPDMWAGDTFDLAALLENPVPAGIGEGAPAAAPPAPEPATIKQPAEPAKPHVTEAEPGKAKPAPDEAGTVTKAKPRPRKPKPSPTAEARASTVSSAGPPGAGEPGSTGSPSSFGAAGQRGVRNLAKAFTRAVPMAASDAKLWEQLPLGPAGEIELTIRVNDKGTIISALPKGESVPSHLRTLVERTIAMLRAGRFALGDAVEVGEGAETLRISVALSQAEGQTGDSSGGAFALGFEPPSSTRAGRAYLTLSSGRHVEVMVKRVATAG